MWIFSKVNSVLHLLFGVNLLGPFALQLLPRLILLFLSFSVDLSVLHLSGHYSLDSRVSSELLASSHLTLVYCLHTLSNTIELVLLSVLLVVTIQNKGGAGAGAGSGAGARGALLGLITTLGLFNRPTFPVFAAWPLLLWVLPNGGTGNIQVGRAFFLPNLQAANFLFIVIKHTESLTYLFLKL